MEKIRERGGGGTSEICLCGSDTASALAPVSLPLKIVIRISFLLIYIYRPKRSFGQGNVFTSVCHEFCSQGGVFFGGVSAPNFRGVGGVCSKFSGGGGIFRGGCLLQIFGGVSAPNFGVGGWGGIFRGGVCSKFSGGASPPEYGHRSAGTHPTGMHSCPKNVPKLCTNLIGLTGFASWNGSYIAEHETVLGCLSEWMRFIKSNLTLWGSDIMRSLLKSRMMDTKITQNVHKIDMFLHDLHLWPQNWSRYVWTLLCQVHFYESHYW